MIKKIINSFRELNVKEKGWLGIRGHYFGRDKQKHVVIGLVFMLLMLIWFRLETAVAYTVVMGIVKEIFDTLGITKFIYKTIFNVRVKKSMASGSDFLCTIFIPIVLQLIDLYIL